MSLKRVYYIDFLKAIAIIFLIIIHVLSNHLDNKQIFFIWNYLHFVVVIFVFSSGYLFALSLKNNFKNFKDLFIWLKKRVVRLVFPYYLFLSLHYLLWIFFPQYFYGYGLKKNTDFIFASIFLVGGVDYNWFVLLFVFFTILSPLIAISLRKKIIFLIIFLLSLTISLLFSFYKFPYSYFKWVMVWSWLFIFYLGIIEYFLEEKLNKKQLIFMDLTFIFIWIVIFYIFTKNKSPLVFTENKYPPNLILFSYGLIVNFFIIAFSRLYQWQNFLIKNIINFLSRNSYNLFFIHYLAMDFVYNFDKKLVANLTIGQKIIWVIFLSLLLTFIIDHFSKKIKIKLISFFIFGGIILGLIFINERLVIEKSFLTKQAIAKWIQKPAAVRFIGQEDRSYFSWISHSGKVQIRYFDHRKKQFSSIYTVDDLYPDFRVEAIDDHNSPSLMILPNGEILIFYVVHDVENSFFLKKSQKPEDIRFWSKRVNLANKKEKNFYNYPQPKRLDNGRLFLFFRKGSFYQSKEYYKYSDNNGQTWSDSIGIVDFGKIGVYAFLYQRKNSLFLAWNLGKDGYPPKFNLYYAYSSDGGENWLTVDKQKLTTPITDKEKTLVLDSENRPLYIRDLIIDHQNYPRILYSFDNDPHHKLKVIYWDGKRWQDKIITESKLLYNGRHFFSGGGVFDPKSLNRVAISKFRDKLEIEIWRFDNKNWLKEKSITQNSLFDNFYPQFVENYHQELSLFWAYGQYEGLIDGQWTGFGKVGLRHNLNRP